MSIPTTSAPILAIGTAVVPSPHPRSRTRIGKWRLNWSNKLWTNSSPDSLIIEAIRVKSPFSHNALFGFMIESVIARSGLNAGPVSRVIK